MDISVNNKIVIITGGVKGIGAAIASLFHEDGATVLIFDILGPGQESLLKDNTTTRFYLCDVSDGNQVKKCFYEIQNEFGRIDILVNNAGVQTYGKVGDTGEEVWDKTLNVNLKSAFLCSKYAVPLMESSTHPVIINISSVQALVCEENVAAYVASKAGMLGLTKAIAVDYAPHIRCVAVCPGAVNTEMLKDDLMRSEDPDSLLNYTKNIHLMKRIASPEEIASFVLFLSSEQASFCTGQYYRIDGGIGSKISII
jgi:NAD(P)-dependent dehydrogenase (short-subunit alcohol dehydrogenase family)